jgi:Xaa-Pro aminopeptidase
MGMRHAVRRNGLAPLLRSFVLVAVLVAGAAFPAAERMGYAPEEFSARRARLGAALQAGTVVLFASTQADPGVRFRQDNDFFYLTGSEAINAVLVMDAATRDAHLFMPKMTAGEIQFEGANWLEDPEAARKYGFTSVQPLTALQPFLAARRAANPSGALWARLSERDTVSNGRVDVAIAAARRIRNPLAQHPSEDELRADALRRQLPQADIRDVTPQLDRLRLIKTAREIEILRYNGRISAEAMRRSIAATAPARFEYELEAEATHWMLRHGLQSPAYPAIVASGPMGNQWHYESNGRRMNAGELIVMDYGGSLDHLTIDITRTWPVSGQFTELQRRAYDTTLEAQKAIIAAIRPGVARSVVQRIAQDVFRKNGFDARYAYVGHYVGLSVHDVGDWDLPFETGMVMAIEPILDMPQQQLHIRVEDTILVTDTGAEVLTGAVPKEVTELLPLIGQDRR